MAVRSRLQRVLLVSLLVADGAVVSVDRLVEDLWGVDPPHDPAQALQSHVSRLRALLQEEGGDAERDRLQTVAPGYRLVVDADQVDARRFERLARQAAEADDPGQVVTLADAALALWRGAALDGFDHDRARAEAVRLEQLRLGLAERRADALLALGRAREVVAELEALVATHPLREQLHARLMLALYRSGRQADALAVCRTLRDRLADELGLEPSVELRRLERDILQQRDELAGPAADAPAATADDHLPLETTSFVGRDTEVAGVTAALHEGPLVTLTGVGGVGKTRLALRVARDVVGDHRDGVRTCELSEIQDASQVVDAIATRLRVQPPSGTNLPDAVVAHLRHQDVVLLLDNCEHVLEGVVQVVDRILRACHHVRILATSRQPLGIDGEQAWPVPPLPVKDASAPAVELFRDRARATAPGIPAHHLEHDLVVELCRRLDGLPLAIELAATRIRSMTPADIVARLDQRLELLGGVRRSGPERHRTLRAVVAWSHDLLAPEACRLFDRLSVFAGGFTLEGAEAVCSGQGLSPDEVAGRLGELVDHSLVVVDRSGARARYRLLETLRLYAEDQLGDDREAWQRRHAAHHADLARAAEEALQGGDVGAWVDRVDAELANLRAVHRWALRCGDVELALRLPCRLHRYAMYRQRDEVFRWADAALHAPGAESADAYPLALAVAAEGCAHRGDVERASRLAHEARRRAGEDAEVRLRTLGVLCEVALFRRRLVELRDQSRQLVELGQRASQPYDEAYGHLMAGFGAMFDGRAQDALAHVRRGRAVADAIGNADMQASLTFLEGQIQLDTDPAVAEPAIRAAIDQADAVGNRFVAGVGRVSLAGLLGRHGDADAALRTMRDAIDPWRRGGQWTHVWATLRDLLDLFARLGEHEPAVVLHGVIERVREAEAAFGVDAEQRSTAVTALRPRMGTERFAAAETRGRGMDDDEAVAWVLETIDRLLADHPSP